MKNWKTNLGGAIAVTGTALTSIGVLAQLSQLNPNSTLLSDHQLNVLWYVALVGFILIAIGKGITSLFAADASSLKALQAQINQIPPAIESGNTEMLKKVVAEQKQAIPEQKPKDPTQI